MTTLSRYATPFFWLFLDLEVLYLMFFWFIPVVSQLLSVMKFVVIIDYLSLSWFIFVEVYHFNTFLFLGVQPNSSATFLTVLHFHSQLSIFFYLIFRRVNPMSHDTPKPPGYTRFVCISDTHSRTDTIQMPYGDILIHAGDFTELGLPSEVKKFNDWLGQYLLMLWFWLQISEEGKLQGLLLGWAKLRLTNKKKSTFVIKYCYWGTPIWSSSSTCHFDDLQEIKLNIKSWLMMVKGATTQGNICEILSLVYTNTLRFEIDYRHVYVVNMTRASHWLFSDIHVLWEAAPNSQIDFHHPPVCKWLTGSKILQRGGFNFVQINTALFCLCSIFGFISRYRSTNKNGSCIIETLLNLNNKEYFKVKICIVSWFVSLANIYILVIQE